MSTIDLHAWSEHLLTLSRSPAPDMGTAPPRPLRLWLEGAGEPAPENARYDDALWWALIDGSLDADAALQRDRAGSDGPLFPQSGSKTIEVWTERDLSGLHALWRLASARNRADLLELADSVARWHVEHVQPDNATNRPWAVHVFLLLARDHDWPEARLHAETLLHNCLSMSGAPDPVSAMILADAGAALRDAASDG